MTRLLCSLEVGLNILGWLEAVQIVEMALDDLVVAGTKSAWRQDHKTAA
jgi:hypothetical protein